MFVVIFLLFLVTNKESKTKIEEEFVVINDKNCEDTGLEAPLGFSLSELPVSGHPNQRNVTKSSLDKDKSKMVGLEKLPVTRTRSISVQNPSSFPTSFATPSV